LILRQAVETLEGKVWCGDRDLRPQLFEFQGDF
jgi:hypothetical protein